MKDEEKKITSPATESKKPTPIWGIFIITILKKWLGFNRLLYGTKKKF